MPVANDGPLMNSDLGDKLVELKSLALKILETDPKNSDALNGLGLVSMQLEAFDYAVSLFQEAHNIAPKREEYTDNLIKSLGLLSQSMCDAERLPEATKFLEQALLIKPNDVLLMSRLSLILGLSNRNEEALVISEQAISSQPKSAKAHEVNGLALLGLDRIDPAINSLRTAIKYDNLSASLHSNLGLAYRAKGDLEEAIKCFERAIVLDENHIQAYNNLGVSYLESHKLDRAQEALEKAIDIDYHFAEAHFNLSRTLLMAEKFEVGWEHNEWRWDCPTFPSTKRNFPQPIWNGEDIKNKKILVWSEQGIGDEIMFSNTLPELVGNSASVLLECSERLVPIFRRSFEGMHVFSREDPPSPEIKNFNADVQIPLGSICKFYRTKSTDFPTDHNGYLRSNPKLTKEVKSLYSSLGSGLKIGVSWRSGNPIVGQHRSIPIKFWHEIFSIKGCHFINLQYGDYKEDLTKILDATGVNIFHDNSVNPIISAEHWFSQIAALDLVISIDNSTMQVSGALGIPTWTLVSHNPEWRFGLNRLDHLWHPTVRIFRQQTQGEWVPLMREVTKAFTLLIKSKNELGST